MSSRVKFLCIATAMTALAANSTIAYVAGREPAIFSGPAYVVLLFATLAWWSVVVVDERQHRRDVRAKADDFRLALMLTQWHLTDSGSWRRPNAD